LKSLKGRDLLTLLDFTGEEVRSILEFARNMKLEFKAGRLHNYLAGKSIALIFQKPSTRTRVSFDVGIYQLGGHPIYLGWSELQLGRGETIADTARTLDRYVDGIVARVYKHFDLEELARYADVPVINALSDLYHPCQALGDYLTMWEKTGRTEGLNVVFIGDGVNNVCSSLIVGAAKLGANITVCSPKKYWPRPELLEAVKKDFEVHGGQLRLAESPTEAVKDADVIYTDVWVSMGMEAEAEERLKVFQPYQVNSQLLSKAPDDVMVMHCLPAKRGLEATDEVLDGPHSIIWDQAENRLHAQKAVLALLIP